MIRGWAGQAKRRVSWRSAVSGCDARSGARRNLCGACANGASSAGVRRREESEMEADTLTLTDATMALRKRRNPRGVFQKAPGKNNPWWICYWDAQGRKRREKAGTKSAAVKLYQLRKAQVLEGRKLPTRKPPVLFGTLIDDALVYSREHHGSRWRTEIGYIVIAARE